MTKSTFLQSTDNADSNDVAVLLLGFLLNGGLELSSQAAETDLKPLPGDSMMIERILLQYSLHHPKHVEACRIPAGHAGRVILNGLPSLRTAR